MGLGRELVVSKSTLTRKNKAVEAAAPNGAYQSLVGGVVSVIEDARRTAARSVNAGMTAAYWLVGRQTENCRRRLQNWHKRRNSRRVWRILPVGDSEAFPNLDARWRHPGAGRCTLDARCLMQYSAVIAEWRDEPMRTTLNIDVDVLAAAKEIAQRERKTAGQSVSELMREGLQARAERSAAMSSGRQLGFRPIPAGGATVTNQLVNDMRDELGV